jgi:hypothetical protein
MRTQVAGVRHDLAAETQPLALIGGECGFDIGVSRERIGKTLRVGFIYTLAVCTFDCRN